MLPVMTKLLLTLSALFQAEPSSPNAFVFLAKVIFLVTRFWKSIHFLNFIDGLTEPQGKIVVNWIPADKLIRLKELGVH